MGIARAIRRVKRQAKQGGLNAVMSGLGEGLRSRAVPAPLRGAARKIASLIDPTRAPSKVRHASHATRHAASHATSQSGRPSSAHVEPGIARPPAQVTATGVDSGAEPSAPADDTPVDAATVGATPTFNATPLEVAPLDASPLEVTPNEVTPVEVSLHDLPSAAAVQAELHEESELSTEAAVEGRSSEPLSPKLKAPAKKSVGSASSAGKKASPAASKPKTPEAAKEKLAAAGEAAKSVARSGSRTAKKPASTRADTTSKKK